MPRGKGKSYNNAQRQGMEFSGAVQQNGVQPRQSFNDLSPKEQMAIIKRTGQDARADAIARERNWLGQDDKKPLVKRSEQSPIPGYYGVP